jgi:hypothetical protein
MMQPKAKMLFVLILIILLTQFILYFVYSTFYSSTQIEVRQTEKIFQVQQNYSIVECFGGETNEILGNHLGLNPLIQTCVLKNLCLENGQFTLYLNKNLSNARFYKNFGDPNIITFKDMPDITIGNINLRIHSKEERIPQNASWMNSSIYTISNQRGILNAGHLIGDAIKPIFMMMFDTNFYSGDSQHILLTSCSSLPSHVRENGKTAPENCQRIQKKYYSIISHHENPYLELAALNEEYKGKTACMKRVILGDKNRFYMSGDNDHPGAYRKMRNSFYRNNNILTFGKLPKKHQITILYKEPPRHAILNVDELVDYLKKYFNEINVVLVDSAKMNKTEEAKVLSKTSILITPSGGTSFISMFLPDHAVAIFLLPCYPCSDASDVIQPFFVNGTQSCCRKLESLFFGYISHFSKKYFRPSITEPLVKALSSSSISMLDYGYKVDLYKMRNMVKESVEELNNKI